MVDIPAAPVTDAEDEDRFSVLRLDAGLARHHVLLCEALQGIANGTVQNLMVLMPPGAAKSTYVDVLFVPWFMALFPRRNVILASYASDIARKQGRRARQLIKSRSFRNLFDLGLAPDQSAADEWALTNQSEYMAGGLLSGLTGNRGALGILDDPIKGRKEAESQTIRDTTWEAYTDDFCSRLIPGAPQVMILTRWHADDPAGRILPPDWAGQSGVIVGRDGRTWLVLCLPALCDRDDDPLERKIGESLWPEWFGGKTGDPMDHWRPFMKNARTWSSLYQQKPSPEEGTYFKREYFKFWTDKPDATDARVKPKNLKIYGTSDYAVTEGGGDWTVHRIWGIDEEFRIYRLDGWRGQTASDEWIERQLDLVAKHKPAAWFGESGVIQKAIEPMLKRRMRERNTRCRLEWLPSISDKPTRARGFQGRAAGGEVYFEPGADIGEFLTFPAGAHDDDVDTASLIGRALDEVHPALAEVKEQPKEPVDAYERARARRAGVTSWKTA